MRILQLTAGTGSFHCGTCIRDNALVVELRRQGHDAMLVPLYLPVTLDEEPATPEAPLFFGGVNVYLQQKSALFRNSPRWVDRLFDSPGLLRAAGHRAGMTKASDLGELTLSMPRGEDGLQVKELDRLTEWMEQDGHPDVVCLSNVLLIGLARRIKQRTGARILCFLNGEDGFLDSLPDPQRQASWDEISDRAGDIDAFLPVSRFFGDLMSRRARLPAGRMHVVYPGILLEGYETDPPESRRPPTLGYLARMCPAKGLETLVDAYLLLRAKERMPDLRLRIAGSCTPADQGFVDGLRERLDNAGAGAAVEFLPNLDREEKIRFLQSLMVFSVPATYGEAFGIYVVEALAAGVPVVQPRHGAFPELLEATGGGVLCEPDNPEALASAIEELLRNPETRALADEGREAVRRNFSVERMARQVLQLLEGAGNASHTADQTTAAAR